MACNHMLSLGVLKLELHSPLHVCKAAASRANVLGKCLSKFGDCSSITDEMFKQGLIREPFKSYLELLLVVAVQSTLILGLPGITVLLCSLCCCSCLLYNPSTHCFDALECTKLLSASLPR